ncbi:hypothetical protein V8F33_005880 [Rhypophila sp. PSN 637]
MSNASDSVNNSPTREGSPEDHIDADVWKDMAFEYNVGPRGPYPSPLSGGEGFVKSVRIHNAIGAYAAMMAREDALDKLKSSAADKSAPPARRPTKKAAVPKGPTRSSTRKSSVLPAVPAAPGAPIAPVAPAAAAQRVTRSSARHSSSLNSGVTATPRAPDAFLAPAPLASGAHLSPAAHATGSQRVTRSSARQSSTLNSGVTGAPSDPPSNAPATLVAPTPTVAAPSATRVPVAKGSKTKIYQTPTLVPPVPAVAAPPAPSKLRLVLTRSDSNAERSINTIVSQNGPKIVIHQN